MSDANPDLSVGLAGGRSGAGLGAVAGVSAGVWGVLGVSGRVVL